MQDILSSKNTAFQVDKQLILATHNAGKIVELRNSLSPLGWTLHGMNDFSLPSPEENGGSFEANATLKAQAAGLETGLWALADDSGLEVDALGGMPGVDTSSYGGWEKLLDALKEVEPAQRSARFTCVLALWRKELPTLYFKGICEGTIALHAAGNGGFGYDPVFIPRHETRTFAEMDMQEKSALSHRGQAVAAFLSWIGEHGQSIPTV